ncbi:MAG: four helix bundle protein [Bacteroidetes bacterium]|nr:four helix bundle protein [Bacteroidota bacterium]
MHNFKELKVWQRSRELVKKIYDISSKFPDHEKFVLVSQIRRAVISLPSNIAEGCGSNSDKEFNRYLGIAMSSSYELETQLYLAFDLQYLFKNELDSTIEELNEIQRMLVGLKKKLDFV